MTNRICIYLLMAMVFLGFYQGAKASDTKVEQIGRQAVKAALDKLNASPESPLACITNAGYVKYKGCSTRIIFDIIPKHASISLGASNLLPVHSRWDEKLWFVFLKKGKNKELLMTYVFIRENIPVATEPINVYVRKNQSFEPFKKVLGNKAFSVVTLANGWSDNIPEDMLSGALYHDHLCCGVFSGYFTVRFIQKHIPLKQGEKYIYIGAPAWCQDDYLMTPLNLTPGKHGYYTMDYPWSRPWKTGEKTYDKLGGIIIQYHKRKNIGRAYLLRFDWQEEHFRKFVGMPELKLDWKNQPWLHILYCRFFLKNLDRPEFFVSVLKEIPLKKRRDLDRLIKLGANPLAEMLGQDNEWSTSLK